MMESKYFQEHEAQVDEGTGLKPLLNISRDCVAALIIGGAAVTTVSIGSILGVPAHGTNQIGLGAISLAIGIFAWVLLRKRTR